MSAPKKQPEKQECVCTDNPLDLCYTVDPDGVYVCTRRRGHSGDHVACSGSQHRLKTWPAGAGRRNEKEREEIAV